MWVDGVSRGVWIGGVERAGVDMCLCGVGCGLVVVASHRNWER